MDEPQAEQTVETPPPTKKKGGLLLKLFLILFLLGGVGGGAAWWLLGTRAEAATPAEPALEARGMLSFEPFLVNLTDSGGNRFLKATIELVVGSGEEATHIEETAVVMGHLRSTMLELLAQQSATALVTPEGKDALKKAIRARTNAVLKADTVIDVLFAEFVVQF